tara:strand:+ start:416 stop:778 length:363 start_codon:yes stop_codon:yes gene_type:complete
MSVKELKIGKRFIQVEKSSVNVPTPSPQQQKTITQNKQNLHSDELLKLLLNKIDSIENKTIVKNVYGESESKTNDVIDIDFKKELYIGKLDKNSVKSEEIKGKVNNKLDKLKALRRKNGS